MKKPEIDSFVEKIKYKDNDTEIYTSEIRIIETDTQIKVFDNIEINGAYPINEHLVFIKFGKGENENFGIKNFAIKEYDNGIKVIASLWSELIETGNGFMSKYNLILEDAFKSIDSTCILAEHSLSVGRYIGARDGFNFLKQKDLENFRAAFIEFLKEKDVLKIVVQKQFYNLFKYNGKIPTDELAKIIQTPQDILRTTGEVSYTMKPHVDEIHPPKQKEEKCSAGKAFFLDTESRSKKGLRENGVWLGIKPL